MPANVSTNYPFTNPPDSVNVLLLDWLNTQPRDQTFVHAQAVQYLKQVPTGTRLAIFTLGTQLRMVHGFTADLSELVSAFDSSKAARTQVSPLMPTTVENSAEQNLIALMDMNHASPVAIEAVKQEMEATSGSNTGNRIAITLEALQELGRYLSPIPGRKNVIWIAGSFPASQDEIRRTADMLTPSRVAIYPVSGEGLLSDATYDPEYDLTTPGETKVRQRRIIAEENDTRAANQIAMEELANDTGGRAFDNTNGLAAAMASIVDNGARYYTLTYTPTNKNMDGRYRSIHVKLRRGAYRLVYRPGYYAEGARIQEFVTGDPLLSLIGFGLPDFSEILYKIRVIASDPQPADGAPHAGSNAELKGPFHRYGVDFAILPDDLTIEKKPDGTGHAKVKIMLVAYDRDGRPLNSTAQKGDIHLTPKAYEDARRVGLQVHLEIDVPQVGSSLRTGVYDLNSGKAGTLGIPLSSVTVATPH
jgi:VWFA-related protein